MNLTYATGCLFCTLPSHNNYSGELVAERQLLSAHPHKPLDTAVGVFLDRPDWTSAASHRRVQPRDVCPSPLRERRGWEFERVCVGMYGVRALCPVGVQVHAPSGKRSWVPGSGPSPPRHFKRSNGQARGQLTDKAASAKIASRLGPSRERAMASGRP